MITGLRAAVQRRVNRRAEEVPAGSLRRPQPPSRRRWYAALAIVAVMAVWAAALVIATSDNASSSDSASPAAGVVGYRWDLTFVKISGAAFAPPPDGTKQADVSFRPRARYPAYLSFRPGGALTADDSVDYAAGGRYRLTTHGYQLSGDVYSTSTARVHDETDDVRYDTELCVSGALSTGYEIIAHRVGDTLSVQVGVCSLTLHRGATVGNAAPPSSRSTR